MTVDERRFVTTVDGGGGSNQSVDDGSKPELRTIQRFATVDDRGSRRRFRFELELRTIQRFTTVDYGGSRRGETGDGEEEEEEEEEERRWAPTSVA
ncbi:hypothetical protein U1Q18_027674 [Sarracenia purpurea var. burkii]